MPARASARAGSTHSGGTHAMWVITDVRMLGGRRPPPPPRSRASSVSMSASETSSPNQLSPVQWPPPRPPVPVEELVGARRPPRAGGVVRERRTVALPGRDDRVDEQPLLLDLVGAREQRRVAEHRVEDQPLVRLRHAGAERAAVEEVHVHGADRHPLARHLRADRERDPLVGLDVDDAARSGAGPRRPSPRTAGAAPA